jgi:hypothetical protein
MNSRLDAGSVAVVCSSRSVLASAVLQHVGPGLQALGQFRDISLDEVNRVLATAPHLERLLGEHYRKLADRELLKEDLLPLDWTTTNADLERILSAVDGFRTHQPIRTGRPRADIYTTLAEIEGFSWLLDQGFDRVEALPYRSIRGGYRTRRTRLARRRGIAL